MRSEVLDFPLPESPVAPNKGEALHPAVERGWALREYGKILLRDAQKAVLRARQLVAESRRIKIRFNRYG